MPATSLPRPALVPMTAAPHASEPPRDLDRDFLAFRDLGDVAALARVFDGAAPELLRVASHLTPDRHAAEDVVQTTFLAAMEHKDRFDACQRVMPWLLGILANRVRLIRRAAARQPDPERLAETTRYDAPLDVAQAGEFSAAVARAIADLPAPYQPVLNLHLRHGLSAKEIAEALSCPRGTVRSRMSRGMELLRRLLPPGFAASLAGTVLLSRRLSAMRGRVLENTKGSTPEASSGNATPPRLGLLKSSTTHWALLCTLVALGVAFGVWKTLDRPTAPDSRSQARAPRDPEANESLASAPRSEGPRQAVAPTTLAGARVEVRVRRHNGGTAAGVAVLLHGMGSDGLLGTHWQKTDERGIAAWDGVAAGEYRAVALPGGEVVAGIERGTQQLQLKLPRGIDVQGKVLDAEGNPVADARVHLTLDADRFRHVGTEVARSDARGQFVLHNVEPGRQLSAFVPGAVPSWTTAVRGAPASTQQVELRCGGHAGAIEGTVRGIDGKPLADATALAGALISWRGTGYGSLPAVVTRTGADGAFQCANLPPGRIPLWIGAVGMAPSWQIVEVGAGETTTVDVRLLEGGSVHGVVHGGDGRPRSGVRVRIEPDGQHPLLLMGPGWAHPLGITGEDGRFRIAGVRPGALRCRAYIDQCVVLSPLLQIRDGESSACDIALAEPSTRAATLVDAAQNPLGEWEVELTLVDASRRSDPVRATTDLAGMFRVPVLEDAEYEVRVREPGSTARRGLLLHERLRGDGPMRVVVPARFLATATLTGSLADPTGAPLAGQRVSALYYRDAWWEFTHSAQTGDDGTFTIGPVPSGRFGLAFGGKATGMRVVEGFEVPPHARIDTGIHTLERPAQVTLRPRGPLAERARFARITCGGMHLTQSLVGGTARVALQPGTWAVSFRGPGIALNHALVDVQPGAELEVDTELHAGVEVPLEYDPSGRRARWTFEWFRDGALLARESLLWPPDEYTVFDRVADLACLPAGACRLRITDERGRSREAIVDTRTPPPNTPLLIQVPR